MPNQLRLPVFTLALLLGVLTIPGTRALADVETHKALLGKAAPEIEADFAVNGKPVRLASLKGKVVLLTFCGVWSGTTHPALTQLRNWDWDHRTQGLVIVAVTPYNVDFGRKLSFDTTTGRVVPAKSATHATDREMLRDFAAHHKIDFCMMQLPFKEYLRAMKVYGVRGIPQFVLIDRKGLVHLIRVGSHEDKLEEVGEAIKKLIAKR